MEVFAVIDTETNWHNEVMSIGVAIGLNGNFELLEKLYYVITPEVGIGGIFDNVLFIDNAPINLIGTRSEVLCELRKKLDEYEVKKIFAYSAGFDRTHLMELSDYKWYDIMALAANKNYNKKIPESTESFTNGKVKKGASEEAIYRILSSDFDYKEVHNGLIDAIDELDIMRMLNIDINEYIELIQGEKKKKKKKIIIEEVLNDSICEKEELEK